MTKNHSLAGLTFNNRSASLKRGRKGSNGKFYVIENHS